MHVLEATGERVIPELQREELVFAEHVARYRLAAQLASGKRVLDAACGEGYGCVMLREAGAASVVGLDVDRAVVEHVRRRHGIDAVEGDVRELPFEDASFDLVVSFETIEHMPDPGRAIAEFRRVLTDEGQLVISTPNRDEYLIDNEYHSVELTPDEFLELLGVKFSDRLRLFQQNWLVSAVVDERILRSDDPDKRLQVSLAKTVGAAPGQELFSVVVCGAARRKPRPVAVATGIYEAQRMAVELGGARGNMGELLRELDDAKARGLEAERQRATSEHEQAAWQARALEAERQRALSEHEQAAWQARAREADTERTPGQSGPGKSNRSSIPAGLARSSSSIS